MNIFDDVKQRLGFGCMRFPMKGKEIDEEQVEKMVDAFVSGGFNYFDTAHGYLDMRSEKTLRKCLTSRYPRESYLLANKLSNAFFEKEEDILPLFQSQLEACGVEYFDFYLMHALNADYYEKYSRCKAFEITAELKKEGKIRHLGMSFHDSAAVLRRILTERPEIEFVQLQLNYLDWDSESVQSRLCYETCVEFGKPVVVMEPVKGGTLAQLLPEADAQFDRLEERGSNASYALRFVMGLDNVKVILSGMSDMKQMEENMALFREQRRLDEKEMAAIERVKAITLEHGSIACTSCHYCTEVCPIDMPIPSIFTLMNSGAKNGYKEITKTTKASDCLKCGKCERACPQHLPIKRYLDQAAFRFEKS